MPRSPFSRNYRRLVTGCLLAACLLVGSLAHAQSVSPPSKRPPGVTAPIESSIKRGLRFLTTVQQSDGSFGKSRWEPETYPTAMTALNNQIDMHRHLTLNNPDD